MKQTEQQFLSSLGKKLWNAADRLRYDYYFDQAVSESSVMTLVENGTRVISLGHNTESLGHSRYRESGCLVIKDLEKPLIDNLDKLSEDIADRLMTQAQKARERKMRQIV